MFDLADTEPCPCGSGRPFARCCQAYLSRSAWPPTAEALMRSRYTAFALRQTAYLLDTWHPSTRPARLQADTATRWLGLKVLVCDAGTANDHEGWVHFVARYKIHGRGYRLSERSRFVRDNGRWFYVDGVQEETQKK